MLMQDVKDIIGIDVDVRGFDVDEEPYDLMLFLNHNFVRPTMIVLYAIRHRDVTIADDPKRLRATVRNSKTGGTGAQTLCQLLSASMSTSRSDTLIAVTKITTSILKTIIDRRFHPWCNGCSKDAR